ncbi:two-component system, OmpR family, sensor histidine kinase KdpD [Paenibacillus polysaccharolyticus]|uniref:Two-component system, OmpR family, sensor histidine kinase KdpD n=1 Tax=Paenibacillus polysaccharolyticus TaxID=582692 RepID=A0A1G5L744_9BACL|nr:histidine kinase [Paenibacillus polysaccharolyticus]SCZ08009.1 two-component system, OmpR family, sensor histidine kinase KdpD [Paenibacillus polysaccharolyticus]
MEDSFKRKSPEEMLRMISKLQEGTFKIYIGPVSGSGKTYHMLRDGNQLREQGVDVVICAVSTMRRPETVEQLGELERVPSIHWIRSSDGAEMKDLNLDALLVRNPEVVLVDGLAHRNREGARHATRLEDIRFLLHRNISVITTVNVYELEGYTELARQLTGINVSHTVPADTLELADEVKLIDVTPETILSRLAEGHLQGHGSADVFRHGNLGILRELALKIVAEGVNESLREHRKEMGLPPATGIMERILVSAQYHWNGSIYIQRGQQIARRLNGSLHVVVFRPMKQPLTREATVFRRNMMKLVEKIGGHMQELPVIHHRYIPATLVQYAIKRQITRIVMGHSRRTRWQELWQGSLINSLLRKLQGIDLLLVADRSAREGERVVPAKVSDTEQKTYRRLSEQEMKEQIGLIRRGTFKIYIGAAPGVGKTYMMLREGNDLLRKGIHVQIGLLETHGRADTVEQIGSLPIIPRAQSIYQGACLEEMDTEAILQLHPEVVLVDELAHTNVPGNARKKRYEDVLRLLDAGISVITTVNVQHLESLNDAVEHITGVRVRETVPDKIIQLADEVQLIDVAPEALRQRMREGKIYATAKVEQALANFFKIGNLIALRELALRELADDVDERLESQRAARTLRGPWRREESVFVCVSSDRHAERLIRRGFRMAYRLKASWHVHHVHIGTGMAMTPEVKEHLAGLEQLTVRLGGHFHIHQSAKLREVPGILDAKATEAKATQLVVGQAKRVWWLNGHRGSGSVVNQLVRLSRHRDVLIVADDDYK